MSVNNFLRRRNALNNTGVNGFKFYRWTTCDVVGSSLIVGDLRMFGLRLYTLANGLGIEYIESLLPFTLFSNTGLPGFLMSSSSVKDANTQPFEAFSFNSPNWFWPGATNSVLWIQGEFDNPIEILSYRMDIQRTGGAQFYMRLEGSNTGDFTGEETLLSITDIINARTETLYNI